jgi:hypothetical protein
MTIRLEARPEDCLSDLALDRILADEPSPPSAREHLAVCEGCRARLDELTRDRDAFLSMPMPSALRRRPRRRPWAVVTASCGAIALAAATFLFVRVPPKEGGEWTRLKGSTRIGFYVKRSHNNITLGASGESVNPGDSLRFVYTSSELLYLAILSLDGARHASVYYPSGEPKAERVDPGVNRPLNASTVLDETLGEERLFGIFCLQPIPVEPVRAALEATGSLPDLEGCTVDILAIRKEASPAP